jgi:hypothetical protein
MHDNYIFVTIDVLGKKIVFSFTDFLGENFVFSIVNLMKISNFLKNLANFSYYKIERKPWK